MRLTDLQKIIKTLPGVTGVALLAEAPLYDQLGARHLSTPSGDTIRSCGIRVRIRCRGAVVSGRRRNEAARGRSFTADDREGAAPVMIASEEFARRVWPATNPIGRCVRIESATSPCYTVIGVAANARVFDLIEDPKPVFYVPLEQRPDVPIGTPPVPNALVVRASIDPTALVARLRTLAGDTGTAIRTRRVVGDVGDARTAL